MLFFSCARTCLHMSVGFGITQCLPSENIILPAVATRKKLAQD